MCACVLDERVGVLENEHESSSDCLKTNPYHTKKSLIRTNQAESIGPALRSDTQVELQPSGGPASAFTHGSTFVGATTGGILGRRESSWPAEWS